MQLLLCTTALPGAPSEPAGAGDEPRDGEEPSWSFPTYPWSDSPPHNPVPKFPNYTQAFNLITGCYFCTSFSAGISELQKQRKILCREILCHPQWSSILGWELGMVTEQRRHTGKSPRLSDSRGYKDLNSRSSWRTQQLILNVLFIPRPCAIINSQSINMNFIPPLAERNKRQFGN